MIRRLRGATNTTKTVYVGALTLYSVLGATQLHGWANVAAVACILVAAPIAVLGVRMATAARDPFDHLLKATPKTRTLVADELDRANALGLTTWWDQSSFESRWFDTLFAFWWKARGVPSASVAYAVDQPALTAALYEAVPVAETESVRPDKKKAALVKASTFFSDVLPVLHCAPLDYELNMWVDRHGPEFRAHNSEATLYGVNEWIPYPGLTCTHNVLTTDDGWVLLSLRNARTDFFPNAWSLSFEEQAEVGVGASGSQLDATVGETIRRGLEEEFGVDVAGGVVDMATLALGREHSDTETRSVRSCAVMNSVVVSCSLKSIWESLAQPGHVEDIGESAGWMAWRFSHRSDVVEVLKRYTPNTLKVGPDSILNDHRLTVEVSVHPSSRERLAGNTFGWHPTSRARLLLWAEWASVNGLLAK